jgi:hypothetical protein
MDKAQIAQAFITGSERPATRPNVYDWVRGYQIDLNERRWRHDLRGWLKLTAPKTANELSRIIERALQARSSGQPSNGQMVCFNLVDCERGCYGNDLSADSIALMRREFGDELWLHVWW